MIVKPEVIVTPDCPTVMIREPRENVDLDTVIPRLLNTQGWGIGTYFNLQFISHDRSKLLAFTKFVVTEETESLQTSDVNNYQTMTKSVSRRKYVQVGEWWVSPDTTDDTTARQLVWNPGKKVHQVKEGDKVIFESADKDEAARVLSGEQKAA